MKSLTLKLIIMPLLLQPVAATPPSPREVASADQADEDNIETSEMGKAIVDAKSQLSMLERKTDPFGLYQDPKYIPTAPKRETPKTQPQRPTIQKTPPPALAEALRACLDIVFVDQARGVVSFRINGESAEIETNESFKFTYERGKKAQFIPKEIRHLNPKGNFTYNLKLLKVKDRTLLLEDLDKKKPFEIMR